MNNNDIYGDIFDESDKIETYHSFQKYRCWLFPIKGYNHLSVLKNNGTGFWINSDGIFVTAAHNLLNQELRYVAILGEQEYDISICFIEYIARDYRNNICCRDLAICKVDDIKVNTIYTLKPEQSHDILLKIKGFKRKPQSLGLTDVTFGGLYMHEYQYLSYKEEKFTGSTYDMSENVASLKLKLGIDYHGLSGGPVFFDNNIYGMFIGKEFIISKYIISKLNELGVSYHQNK